MKMTSVFLLSFKKLTLKGALFMNQTAKEAANSYLRRWRAKNPEKCKEYRERYWAKRAEREANAAGHEQKEGDTNNG